MMVPEKKFFRLFPGNEVRLRGVGLVRCEEAVTDDSGAVTELRCTIDHSTFGGVNPADGRKVKATLHWISGAHCVSGQVRLYDHLFTSPDPAAEEDWIAGLAQNSCTSLEDCKLPAWVLDLAPFERLQFERLGYFCVDPSSTAETPVFNRTAPLRDPWAKLKKKR
jgi:glutaminyl-tRNA synthetase